MRAVQNFRSYKRGGQQGASAIEFAFIFPMLVGVTYVIIIYSFLFMINQSMRFAAQAGAEAAVAVEPRADVGDYREDIRALIDATIRSNINWLPTDTRDLIVLDDLVFCSDGGGDVACPAAPSNSAVVVRLRMTQDSGNRLFSTLSLPYLTNFPPLPNLTAEAVARL
tara:strand:- start:2193 stop:2693 length:501 start_codon:yes stop_codon:yes gene_type:complete